MRLPFARLVLIVLLASAVAQEPVKPKLTPRIITATRQVSLFTALEKQMLQAVRKKDKRTLEGMLVDDCQITMPKADPLDCLDWIDAVTAGDFTLKTFTIRNMSVTDLGDAALVNFDRSQQATHTGKDLSGEFFVLDLWRKSGESWKLANRYVSRTESLSPSPSASGSSTPAGKE